MNVIAILSDEHSWEMMGFVKPSILRTPNLDRLAQEGSVFTNCYTPCPVCAPARAGFFTGRYIHQLGTWDNSTPYDGTVEGISHRLKSFGKSFACIGKTHFHHEGTYDFDWEKYAGYMHRPDIGCYFRDQKMGKPQTEKRFERIGIKTEDSFDDKVLLAALEWLNCHKASDGWMLYIGFLDPHFPFYVEKECWDYYSSLITEVPEALKPPFSSLNEPLSWLQTYFQCQSVPEETIRRLLIGYHCAVEALDHRIGAVLDAVKGLGLQENTLVCYTSDHGEQLGYHGLWWKCCMFEQSAHIPLIIKAPGISPAKIHEPVNLIDVYPTLCSYMGIPVPTQIPGESLQRLMEHGIDENRKDFTFSEYNCHGIPDAMFMIRWSRYKYVYYCNHGFQLFDLHQDPAENHDLNMEQPDSPETKFAASECHKRLLSVCDPYEVDGRAKGFQKNKKEAMGIESYDTMKQLQVVHPVASF